VSERAREGRKEGGEGERKEGEGRRERVMRHIIKHTPHLPRDFPPPTIKALPCCCCCGSTVASLEEAVCSFGFSGLSPQKMTSVAILAMNPTCTLSTMWTWVHCTIPMLGKEREVAEAVMSISINMVHLQRHFDMLLDSLLILRK
jgi:hypothetical protein